MVLQSFPSLRRSVFGPPLVAQDPFYSESWLLHPSGGPSIAPMICAQEQLISQRPSPFYSRPLSSLSSLVEGTEDPGPLFLWLIGSEHDDTLNDFTTLL